MKVRTTPNPGIRNVQARRLSGDDLARTGLETVTVEEPLEIRINDETFAITMRTPGHDRELVLGFLTSEGVIRTTSDVLALAYCGRVGEPSRGNTMNVQLVPGVMPPSDPETGLLTHRGTLVTSACGVCGRRSIDDLIARVQTLPLGEARLVRGTLVQAMLTLRSRQPIFEATGGSHAASLIDFQGRVLATFEDVGRHNAVDKVIGSRVLAQAMPCLNQVLIVSGRASFEIVQKAFAAGISVVASVSAPSSLAVELAERAGVTLACFVRNEGMTLYSCADRVEP